MSLHELAQPLTSAQEWRRRWPLVMAAIFGFSFHSVMTAYAGAAGTGQLVDGLIGGGLAIFGGPEAVPAGVAAGGFVGGLAAELTGVSEDAGNAAEQYYNENGTNTDLNEWFSNLWLCDPSVSGFC